MIAVQRVCCEAVCVALARAGKREKRTNMDRVEEKGKRTENTFRRRHCDAPRFQCFDGGRAAWERLLHHSRDPPPPSGKGRTRGGFYRTDTALVLALQKGGQTQRTYVPPSCRPRFFWNQRQSYKGSSQQKEKD